MRLTQDKEFNIHDIGQSIGRYFNLYLIKFRRLSSRSRVVVFVLSFTTLGALTLFLTSAQSKLDTSKDKNTIIVQYSLPHSMMPVNDKTLPTPVNPPFTLYGNGLLICGHDSAMPFMKMASHKGQTAPPAAPTAATLSQTEIEQLVKQISDTGYFKLKKSYYKIPVAGNRNILQVNVASGSHYVQYYGDVATPPAYTKTLSILQKYCKKATQPYQSDTAIIRVLKDAKADGRSATSVNTLGPEAPLVQETINNSKIQQEKAQQAKTRTSGNTRASTESGTSNAKTQPEKATTTAEANKKVTGKAAKELSTKFSNKTRQVVQQNGITYEIGIDQQQPKVKNPLRISEAEALGQNTSLATKFKGIINPPKASAATTAINKPVRVVLLLASDGGDPNQYGVAEVLGQQVHDWYCGQVGSCYSYQGVSVKQGTQTMASYMSCHPPEVTGDSCASPLLATFTNTFYNDYGTIYREDVDTILVTAWSTNEISQGFCGWGSVNGNLGIIDSYASTPNGEGNYCISGQALAHEMGHTFGLEHTNNSTLMDGSPYTQYATNCDVAGSARPICTLDSGQIEILRNSPHIFGLENTAVTPPPPPAVQPPPPPPPPPTPSTCTDLGNSLLDSTGGKNVIVRTFVDCISSNKKISQIEVHLDSVGSAANECPDRNRTTVDGETTFSNCPLTNNGGTKTYKVSYIKRAGYHVKTDSPTQIGTQFQIYPNKTPMLRIVMEKDTVAPPATTPNPTAAVAPEVQNFPDPGRDKLNANECLYPGQYIRSTDGRYTLLFQHDGNVAIWSPSRAIWDTVGNTTSGSTIFCLQGDGNLVQYNGSWQPTWYTGTGNSGGAHLIMQSDGNLVLYNSNYTQAIWWSGTNGIQ